MRKFFKVIWVVIDVVFTVSLMTASRKYNTELTAANNAPLRGNNE